MMKYLVGERNARDILASTNERQSSELVYHKHMRKSQEGKTAAQTRKVNLAIKGEINAQKESAESKKETQRQIELREKSEADKSMLMIAIANTGFSTASTNLSTGNKVCFGLLHWLIHSDSIVPTD